MYLHIFLYISCLILLFNSAAKVDSFINFSKSNSTLNTLTNIATLQRASIGSKICMQELGCFEITKDFYHPLYRPFNFLPHDRKQINTQFYLYTRSNPKDSWLLNTSNKEGIHRSPVNAAIPTVFIVHGFLDTKLYVKWMEDLKDNLLLYKDHNVIIVDWSGGNFPPYSQAAANTRVVAAEIALLMNTLKLIKGISFKDCHIIGHSLGAHIAGYTGVQIHKIGRISGIDPAEPFFQNMPPTVRLDTTDAEFVDVIHTDSTTILLLGLGMSQAIGHVDFYPNDGTNQPGCKTEVFKSIFLDGLVEASRRFVSCNHQRAVDFYIHSINYRRAPPVAYACPSWTDYTAGNCADCGENNSKCAVMGIRAYEYYPMRNNSNSLKLYVSTSGSAPYWLHHYQVTVTLLNPKQKLPTRKGKLTITLNGNYSSLKTELTSKSISLEPGKSYKFLVTSEKVLGPIESIIFMWKDYSWSFFGTKTLFLDNIRVVSMNFVSNGERKEFDELFCKNPDTPIKSGYNVNLQNPCESDGIKNVMKSDSNLIDQ